MGSKVYNPAIFLKFLLLFELFFFPRKEKDQFRSEKTIQVVSDGNTPCGGSLKFQE